MNLGGSETSKINPFLMEHTGAFSCNFVEFIFHIHDHGGSINICPFLVKSSALIYLTASNTTLYVGPGRNFTYLLLLVVVRSS